MAFQPLGIRSALGKKEQKRARSQRGDGSLYGEQGIGCAKVTKDPGEAGPCWPEENLRLLPGEQMSFRELEIPGGQVPYSLGV